jgi:steroid delta-isomerase-like uncharacterized protein
MQRAILACLFLCAMPTACSLVPVAPAAASARASDAARVSRLYLECFNEGRLAAADQVIAPDFRMHTGDQGPEGFKHTVAQMRTAFPDLRFALDDVLADRDRVIVRWTMTGTQRGPYMGVPGTDRHVTLTAIAIYRMENGRAVQQWSVVDRLGLMQQLGAVPAAGGAR